MKNHGLFKTSLINLLIAAMNKKIIIILISIGILSGVAAIILTFFYPSQASDNKLDGFAKCLASKNITMYGTPWCEWCQKQEALFGKSFRLVPYVDCSKNPQECASKGINGTPTWIFPDGKTLVGYQELEKLAKESGCELTTNY